jgi:hypothetical protein
VKPGERLDIRTVYSVHLPSRQSTTSVKRGWEILDVNGDDVPAGYETHEKSNGIHIAGVTVTLVPKFPPGRYTIKHTVKSGSSYDTKTSWFLVAR